MFRILFYFSAAQKRSFLLTSQQLIQFITARKVMAPVCLILQIWIRLTIPHVDFYSKYHHIKYALKRFLLFHISHPYILRALLTELLHLREAIHSLTQGNNIGPKKEINASPNASQKCDTSYSASSAGAFLTVSGGKNCVPNQYQPIVVLERVYSGTPHQRHL